MKTRGIISAGHPETAEAAAVILRQGGNAFDAALAALCAACVAEPVLATLGGGGFMLARPAEYAVPVLYDFFVQTPKRKRPPAEVDFYPIVADFGEVQQEFHIGMGSIATPGLVAGLFRMHEDLGSVPMARIMEPAVTLARRGIPMNPLQAHILDVVGKIYLQNTASRELFCSRDKSARGPGKLLSEGEVLSLPDMADAFEALAREGAGLFYRGDMAHTLIDACRTGGGHLTAADLEEYRVEKRLPLETEYRGARLFTNPPPSTGGILIAFALALIRDTDLTAGGFGSKEHLTHLATAMMLTNKARVDSGLNDPGVTAASMLEPGFVHIYRRQILGRPATARGTTQISVMDADGNTASMTVSNGEGAGYILPGTAIMMNNMLGEEDLYPLGLHQWPQNTRIGSMMAPTVTVEADGMTTALGSGGSNRIRTAILQVLVNLLEFRLDVTEAVTRPRIHFESGRLNIEPGFEPGVVAALSETFDEIKVWEKQSIFYGGAHTVRSHPRQGGPEDEYDGDGFTGAGDPRRGGVTITV